MKKYLIRISDPLFTKGIEVDEKSCTTVDNLKRLISNAFHLEISQFTIDNLPKGKNLDPDIKIYDITIKNNSKNVKFQLPNLTSIVINEGYKNKFSEVIEKFQTNKIYFSISSENNLTVNFSNNYFKGAELKKERYPFLGVPHNSSVNIITTDSFVIIDFDQKKFYLYDTDTIKIAHDLIFDAFRKETSYDSIKISKEGSENELPSNYKLKKKDKYVVNIETIYEFKNLTNKKFNFACKLDYFVNVSEAKEVLFDKFKKGGFKLEDFQIMTNKNDMEIAGDYQNLRNFVDKYGNIYYQIKENSTTKTSDVNEGKQENCEDN